ncbi:hypothetical protein HEP87_55105 [Streptomyces sp. S1D4-11]|nr:hypothetical protein [Streptomyces sp. S1D4-11]QIZ01130.1 hypothetical protein HEP87_55105 [Streptomyces sp. S1D4-11]
MPCATPSPRAGAPSAGGALTQLAAAGAYDAAAADLDGDGDIAVANSSAGQVDVFKGACT